MRFRDVLALNISPLLLRLVLGLTFVYAGLPKFKTVTFEGPAAQTMVVMGWATATTPVAAAGSSDKAESGEGATETGDGNGGAAAPEEGVPADDNGGVDADTDADTQIAETTEAAEEAEEDAAAAAPVVTTGPVEARGLYKLALMLHGHNHPYPDWMAWIAATTELVGGALILLGLFSRIWGLGLSITMGYAIYFTTLPAFSAAIDTTGIGKYCRAMTALDTSDAQRGFWQLALLAMALAVFFSGAGCFSVDRLLFRRRSETIRTIEVTQDKSSSSSSAASSSAKGGV